MRRTLVIVVAAGTGAWLGAMVFASFVTAPIAFATLASRHQAGNVVGASLNILYLAAYVLGPLLVFVSILTRPVGPRLLWGSRTILLILMTGSTLVAREFVGAELDRLRRGLGALIETVPVHDPSRILFQQWHLISVLLMFFNMAAAVVVLLLLCLEGSREGRH